MEEDEKRRENEDNTPAEESSPVEGRESPVVEKAPAEEAQSPVEESVPTEEADPPKEEKASAEAEAQVEESAAVEEAEAPVEEKAPVEEAESPVEEKAPTEEIESPVEEREVPVKESSAVEEVQTPVEGNAPVEDTESPVEEKALEEDEDLEDELYEDEEEEAASEEKNLSTVSNAGLPSNKRKRTKRVFPVKKLPLVMRKTYSEKALKRHILKKIYIPDDQKSVAALFIKGANPKKPDFYAIPADRLFTKKEFKRYAFIGREIKKQNKARIRMIPLMALLVLIFGSAAAVIAFKDVIVKNGIISICEGIFQAKTDIDSVEVKILDASITVNRLQVGNKNRVMKNLFEVGKIQLDFNLVQALRKKFVAENLEASGIKWNTDRTYSCELPYKEPEPDSEFMKEVKARANKAIAELQNQAYDILGGSDIDSIIANAKAHINSPKVVKDSIDYSQALIEKWKAKPEEITVQIDEFAETVKNLQTINVKSFDFRNPEDVQAMKDAYDKISAAIEQSKSLKTTAELLVNEIKTDANGVRSMAENVTSTVKADYDYVVGRLTTLKGTIENLDQLFNDALDTVAYNMLGEYYPYVQDGLALVQEMKEKSQSNPKPQKEKKRMEGTTFWYSQEYPSFLIENIRAQGTGFDVRVTEVANNQDVRNTPTTGNIWLNINNIQHSGTVVVDTRTKSQAPLVALNYTGSGFKADLDGTRIAAQKGVPSINGNMQVKARATFDTSGFTAGGTLILDPVRLTTDGFKNELVTKYYRVGLDSVTNLNVSYDVGYSKAKGLNMKLSGNFADQFIQALKNVVMEIGKDVKEAALARLSKELNESENEFIIKAKEFFGIEGDIDLQNVRLSDIQDLLAKKQKEVEVWLKDQADKAINEAKEKATEFVQEKTSEVKQQVTDTLKDSFSSILGPGKKPEVKEDEEDKADESEANESSTDKFANGLKDIGKGLFGR